MLPRYLRGGNPFLYDAIEKLSQQIAELAENQGVPLVPAFKQVEYTDANTARPSAEVVLWVGPVEPINGLSTDLYVKG